MSVTQTVDIPESRRLVIDVPREVPTGVRVVIQFPVQEDSRDGGIPPEARGQTGNPDFMNAVRRAYGAWKDNPWTTHVEDINAMRDEWGHRDPWNPDPAKRHLGE
jgi:hypothetical protein